ncbi:MAG: hypothetical protein NVS3B10_20460 [Polyangiales bacterium]
MDHPRASSSPSLARAGGQDAPATVQPRAEPSPWRRWPWRRWARRVAIGAAIALASLYVLYVVVANVLIKTHVLRHAIGTLPKQSVDYSWASTWWPGRVHVKDLRIQVQDSGNEFLITVDDAHANLDLLALLSKRLHVRSVQAHGVTLRRRARRAPGELSWRETYALPPIPGYDAVPTEDPHPPPPTTDEHYDLFTFDLPQIDADGVREIWIDDYHFTGEAKAHGGFYLRPARKVSVGPARVDVISGQMLLGPDPVLVDMHGDLELTLDTFDPRPNGGALFLRKLTSLDGRLDGRVVSLAFVEHRFLEGGPHLEGGAGPLHLVAEVRDGKLADGFELTLGLHDVVVPLAMAKVEASAQTSFTVHPAKDGKPQAILSVEVAPAEVALRGSENWPIKAAQIGLFAHGENLDLDKPLNDLRYSIDAPRIEITDLRLLQLLLPPSSKLRIGAGAAFIHAHLDAELAAKTAQAKIELSTHTASIKLEDFALSASIGAELKLANLDLSSGDADVSHSFVDLRDVVFERRGTREDAWWGKVELGAAKLRPSSPVAFEAEASANFRDARPILSAFAALEGMPEWIAKLVSLQNFQAVAKLRLGKRIDLDSFLAKAESAEIAARYHSGAGHVIGAILATYRGLTVGIDLHDDSAKPVLVEPTKWFEGAK